MVQQQGTITLNRRNKSVHFDDVEVKDDEELTNNKRKRDEEGFERRVSRKLADERNNIKERHEKHKLLNQDLYLLFNDLHVISSDFGVEFETPEIVVVGMQSDGKSTFVEGLLGFQFNLVDTNIGTRRPLVLQMVNDSKREVPFCRFRRESEDFSENFVENDGVRKREDDSFEERDVPVAYLAEQIVKRTEAKCGTNKNHVSSVPIVLRVEFKGCANLTIIDTPGFRLGGDRKLQKDIRAMVMDLVRPSHRIIVCLEQSTVEWANTLSRPLIKTVDPEFSRTILVNTKFDNRVKELRDFESANKYLEGEGLPSWKRPFFISMPLRRNLDPKRFAEEIDECYLQDFQDLLRINFNEEKYYANIGFFKLKEHLESVMYAKYKESVLPTLRMLDTLCVTTRQEHNAVLVQLKETDLESQKSKVHNFVTGFISLVERFLEGTVLGEPDKYGMTLQEEKRESGAGDWPVHVTLDYEFQNQNFKLYGGAQYERLMNEFEFVAHSIEFPSTSINEVASALGTNKLHNVPLFEAAV
eukprot:TRINITY_DN7681_c0_g1_i3.p1 TRINITY_DN7681_c0_g1~~TRINITY_DN7681_c0_g1_i3.p1  ORF type:complete len:528 (-),score=130.82 TRINITY_DN7681_c0_g1_i3:1432-3015(-)